jgi:hypothetical protein
MKHLYKAKKNHLGPERSQSNGSHLKVLGFLVSRRVFMNVYLRPLLTLAFTSTAGSSIWSFFFLFVKSFTSRPIVTKRINDPMMAQLILIQSGKGVANLVASSQKPKNQKKNEKYGPCI